MVYVYVLCLSLIQIIPLIPPQPARGQWKQGTDEDSDLTFKCTFPAGIQNVSVLFKILHIDVIYTRFKFHVHCYASSYKVLFYILRKYLKLCKI